MNSGFISLIKPKNISSAACVNKIRKLLHVKKAGHSGTLDSLAQGVLVIAIGSSTRLIPYLKNTKTYESIFRFGQYSASYDLGTTVCIDDKKDLSYITPELIQSSCKKFEGEILQQTPVYSACKINGQRQSDRIRQGFIDLPKQRIVRINSISLCHFTPGIFPEVLLKVDCESGTYIRSLCNDLALSLHTKGIVVDLIRTQCNGLSINDSYSFDDIQNGQFNILPELQVLSHLPICIINNLKEFVFDYQNTYIAKSSEIQIIDQWDWKTIKSGIIPTIREIDKSDYERSILIGSYQQNDNIRIIGIGRIQQKSTYTHDTESILLERRHLFLNVCF